MFQELAAVACFRACRYHSVGDEVTKERFVGVLRELEYD